MTRSHLLGLLALFCIAGYLCSCASNQNVFIPQVDPGSEVKIFTSFDDGKIPPAPFARVTITTPAVDVPTTTPAVVLPEPTPEPPFTCQCPNRKERNHFREHHRPAHAMPTPERVQQQHCDVPAVPQPVCTPLLEKEQLTPVVKKPAPEKKRVVKTIFIPESAPKKKDEPPKVTPPKAAPSASTSLQAYVVQEKIITSAAHEAHKKQLRRQMETLLGLATKELDDQQASYVEMHLALLDLVRQAKEKDVEFTDAQKALLETWDLLGVATD